MLICEVCEFCTERSRAACNAEKRNEYDSQNRIGFCGNRLFCATSYRWFIFTIWYRNCCGVCVCVFECRATVFSVRGRIECRCLLEKNLGNDYNCFSDFSIIIFKTIFLRPHNYLSHVIRLANVPVFERHSDTQTHKYTRLVGRSGRWQRCTLSWHWGLAFALFVFIPRHTTLQPTYIAIMYITYYSVYVGSPYML